MTDMDPYAFFAKAQTLLATDIDAANRSMEAGLQLYRIKIPPVTDKTLTGKHARFEELCGLMGKLFEYEDEQDTRDWCAERWIK